MQTYLHDEVGFNMARCAAGGGIAGCCHPPSLERQRRAAAYYTSAHWRAGCDAGRRSANESIFNQHVERRDELQASLKAPIGTSVYHPLPALQPRHLG